MTELRTETLRSLMYKIMDRTSIKGTLASYGIPTDDLNALIFIEDTGNMLTSDTKVVPGTSPVNKIELCTLGQLCVFIDSQRYNEVGDGRIPDLFVNSYNRLGAALMFANVVHPAVKKNRRPQVVSPDTPDSIDNYFNTPYVRTRIW